MDYIVRSSVECADPEGNLAIHGEPSGCKGYNNWWAINHLRKKSIPFRRCTCEQDKAKAEERKRKRSDPRGLETNPWIVAPTHPARPGRGHVHNSPENPH
eukprot:scaffold222179_cov26-Tisochrysis_lutea.AAC.1